jgi:hypothetical protein
MTPSWTAQTSNRCGSPITGSRITVPAQNSPAFATDQLNRLMGFFPRVEAKASFILALDIAMLGVLAANRALGDSNKLSDFPRVANTCAGCALNARLGKERVTGG